jgi:chemotaxis protein CheC
MQLGNPEREMVGVYLQMYGDGQGQALLVLSPDSALRLVNLMEVPRGTTPGIGLDERAALAEFGNVAFSHFCSAVVSFADTPMQIRPSPPAVVVDMQGAIASLTAIPVAATSDKVMIVETVFSDAAPTVRARFWVLPDCAVDRGCRRWMTGGARCPLVGGIAGDRERVRSPYWRGGGKQ